MYTETCIYIYIYEYIYMHTHTHITLCSVDEMGQHAGLEVLSSPSLFLSSLEVGDTKVYEP